MPVFNEEASIEQVVRSWTEVLRACNVAHELRVYDDGSTDGTLRRLRELSSEIAELRVATGANAGHGPLLLRAYREARSEWIFQTDSDGEIPAGEFPLLWREWNEADIVVGYRVDRQSGLARTLISAIARAMVGLLFGSTLRDVNVPFRLFRRDAFEPLLRQLPDETLTPNIVLSGWTRRRSLRVREVPVRYAVRRTGVSSLQAFRLWKFSTRALVQIVQISRNAG